MDPFARKMIVGALAFGSAMLLMAAALAVVYFHMHPQCSEQVLAEAISPDKRWIAAALERRCGDNAPFLLHVNLRPRSSRFVSVIFSATPAKVKSFLSKRTLLPMCPSWNGDHPIDSIFAARAVVQHSRVR